MLRCCRKSQIITAMGASGDLCPFALHMKEGWLYPEKVVESLSLHSPDSHALPIHLCIKEALDIEILVIFLFIQSVHSLWNLQRKLPSPVKVAGVLNLSHAHAIERMRLCHCSAPCCRLHRDAGLISTHWIKGGCRVPNDKQALRQADFLVVAAHVAGPSITHGRCQRFGILQLLRRSAVQISRERTEALRMPGLC